ncbi:hypothetical protein ACFV0R_03035 [Streptomyces sp. NPDC059578]|uniref:hypothetical protein n=1 Tax=unclassified Streptomyces TaxID=2593676 RepID=UPI0036678E63
MAQDERAEELACPDSAPAWLDGYAIDVYPTTNADYGEFARATGHRPPQHWMDGHELRWPTA